MEEFGKSALIAIAGMMASAVMVAGGVVLAPPDRASTGEPAPNAVAAVSKLRPLATWPQGPTPPLRAAQLPEVAAPRLALPSRPEALPKVPGLQALASPPASERRRGPPDMSIPRRARPVDTAKTAPTSTPASPSADGTTAKLSSRPVSSGNASAPPPSRSVDTPAKVNDKPPPSQAVRNGAVPPWRRYAALTTIDEGQPMVAILIDDLGLNSRRMERVIALPAPLTLAILPYGTNLPPLAAKARQKGHELMVHMPMEPKDSGEDPGPNALLVELGREELQRRILWNLSRFEGYVGVNNHMGSRFTAREELLAPLMLELRNRGLLFVDSVTSGASVAGDLAISYGVPSAKRDIFLDNEISLPSIEAQLARVERCARRKGQCIAIGHPHKETATALRRWLPTLKRKGFNLVPISAIIARRRTG